MGELTIVNVTDIKGLLGSLCTVMKAFHSEYLKGRVTLRQFKISAIAPIILLLV
jgi:hypothetical protein